MYPCPECCFIEPKFQVVLTCRTFGKPDSFTIETSTVPPLKPTNFVVWLDSCSCYELQFLQCHLNLLRMVGAIMPSNLKQMQSKIDIIFRESVAKNAINKECIISKVVRWNLPPREIDFQGRGLR